METSARWPIADQTEALATGCCRWRLRNCRKPLRASRQNCSRCPPATCWQSERTKTPRQFPTPSSKNLPVPPNSAPIYTHLRIDSLLAGVYVSHVYHFGDLKRIYLKYKYLLIVLALIPLLFIFDEPLYSYWIQTVGLTMLYISFSALLILFLYGRIPEIPIIQTIGYYSYGIYLFHMYVLKFIVGEYYTYHKDDPFQWQIIPKFGLYLILCLLLGIGASMLIEQPCLRLRDRLVPRH